MPLISIVIGSLLVAVGCLGYYQPDLLGENDPTKLSKTALIPAGIGGVLILCGLIVLAAPKLRKHVMHLAALVGLIGAAGGFMPLQRSGFDFKKASAISGAAMIGLCLLFLLLCIRSFIAARRARTNG
ncbi:MAG: hypothetical protein R3B84_22050 [Zavarzinella sp.]